MYAYEEGRDHKRALVVVHAEFAHKKYYIDEILLSKDGDFSILPVEKVLLLMAEWTCWAVEEKEVKSCYSGIHLEMAYKHSHIILQKPSER